MLDLSSVALTSDTVLGGLPLQGVALEGYAVVAFAFSSALAMSGSGSALLGPAGGSGNPWRSIVSNSFCFQWW